MLVFIYEEIGSMPFSTNFNPKDAQRDFVPLTPSDHEALHAIRSLRFVRPELPLAAHITFDKVSLRWPDKVTVMFTTIRPPSSPTSPDNWAWKDGLNRWNVMLLWQLTEAATRFPMGEGEFVDLTQGHDFEGNNPWENLLHRYYVQLESEYRNLGQKLQVLRGENRW